MSRCARLGIALVAVVIVGAAALGTSARAAPAGGAVCKTLSASGLKLRWSVIGSVSCNQAKPWLVKIVAHHGKPDAKAVVDAPKGFRCSATDDAKGRPSVGFCYTGTVAHPKNGFQWLG